MEAEAAIYHRDLVKTRAYTQYMLQTPYNEGNVVVSISSVIGLQIHNDSIS